MLYGIPHNAEFSELQNIVHVDKNYDSMPGLVADLEHIYCGTMSVEFMHMKVSIVSFFFYYYMYRCSDYSRLIVCTMLMFYSLRCQHVILLTVCLSVRDAFCLYNLSWRTNTITLSI